MLELSKKVSNGFENLHTNLEIEQLDIDEMMHSRSSDVNQFDPEDDRESVKH